MNPMKLSRSSWQDILFLTIFLGGLFFFMIGGRPLSAPDEGRYTEIAREMVATGDYVTPRLNGVKYFEKPPLMYWMTALSLKIAGVKEGAMRFWPAFLGLLGCLGVYAVGASLYGRAHGRWAALILGTSVLFYAHTRLLILDMAVSMWMSFALLSFLMATRSVARPQSLYLGGFFVSMALALLSKGLIGIVLPGCVILIWALMTRDMTPVKLAFNPKGIALFALIALPWHVMAALRNPEFLHFYFIHEHFERYLTTVHGRYQPFWFFVPILAIGWMPWTVFLVAPFKDALCQAKIFFTKKTEEEFSPHAKENLFFLIWAVFIFLFFSVSSSKLIPYILCIFPPLALIGSGAFCGPTPAPSLLKKQGAFLAASFWVMAGAIPIALFIHERLSVAGLRPLWLGLVLLLGVAGGMALVLRAHAKALRLMTLATSVGLLILLNQTWPYLEARSIKPLAQTLLTHLKPQDHVLTFGRYYQDLPPYLGRTVSVVNWQGELTFGMSVEDTSAWMMNEASFLKLYERGGTFYIVTRYGFLDHLKALTGDTFVILDRTDQDVLVKGYKAP